MRAASPEAYKLFTQGVLALADIECTGLPVSLDKLRENSLEIKREIRETESQMRGTDVYGVVRNKYKKNAGTGSRTQLAWVLYEHFKLPGAELSEDGGYRFDKETVVAIQESPETPEEIRDYLTMFSRVQKLQTISSTFIDGLSKECVNGRVHGFIGLHGTKTYRGSADSPNLNNLPSRDAEASKYVKGAVVPRPGYHIVEIDYSGLEVSVATFYHKDPTMIRVITDKLDMHSDFAEKAFFLTKEWKLQHPKLAKELRQQAKGGVFAMQYGDVYFSVACNLWRMTKHPEVRNLLSSKGISKLGVRYENKKLVLDEGHDTYVRHMKGVDSHFWKVLFPVYDKWRSDFWDEYQRKGDFFNYLGFRFHGVFKRNEVINFPVQSVGFGILLWSIIRINKEIKSRGMKVRICLEIHDSLVAECPEDELEEFVSLCKEIMIEHTREAFSWMIFPLRAEVEHSPVSWHDKKGYKHD